jgi:hypothetical protein
MTEDIRQEKFGIMMMSVIYGILVVSILFAVYSLLVVFVQLCKRAILWYKYRNVSKVMPIKSDLDVSALNSSTVPIVSNRIQNTKGKYFITQLVGPINLELIHHRNRKGINVLISYLDDDNKNASKKKDINIKTKKVYLG